MTRKVLICDTVVIHNLKLTHAPIKSNDSGCDLITAMNDTFIIR